MHHCYSVIKLLSLEVCCMQNLHISTCVKRAWQLLPKRYEDERILSQFHASSCWRLRQRPCLLVSQASRLTAEGLVGVAMQANRAAVVEVRLIICPVCPVCLSKALCTQSLRLMLMSCYNCHKQVCAEPLQVMQADVLLR